ncbi:cysteine dioxygenase [Flavilitoribacter nigricans]|nr:cysteine dioxygenase family protein [Flavilitoribacter nigricans]
MSKISPYLAIQRGSATSSPRREAKRILLPSRKTDEGNQSILTEAAAEAMANGHIPNLEKICRELNATFHDGSREHSALQFIPILKQLSAFDAAETERFLSNPQTSYVLVQNDQLKVVLIHWPPGKFSSIHGHAQGGCVFKVLKGSVQEKRYTPDERQHELATSRFEEQAMAYIDDEMAYHAVGNPYDEPAISLHVYTPGR